MNGYNVWLRSLRYMEIEPAGQCIRAYKDSKNTDLTRAFIAAIHDAGGDAAYVVKSGISDLNIVAPVWNSPIIVYGPG